MTSGYITLQNAAEFVGKMVDCYKRLGHHYPLRVTKDRIGRHYITDRNDVMMRIGPADQIPYDFIIKEDRP